MAKTEVYTCDICKQSKDRKDLAHISVRSDGLCIKGEKYTAKEIDICSNCLSKKGFIVDRKKFSEEEDVVSKKNEMTLKDKIYEILSDIGVVFEE